MLLNVSSFVSLKKLEIVISRLIVDIKNQVNEYLIFYSVSLQWDIGCRDLTVLTIESKIRLCEVKNNKNYKGQCQNNSLNRFWLFVPMLWRNFDGVCCHNLAKCFRRTLWYIPKCNFKTSHPTSWISLFRRVFFPQWYTLKLHFNEFKSNSLV